MLLEASKKDGRLDCSSILLLSLLASSERVVAEELLLRVEVSESLCPLPASEGETGTCAEMVSPFVAS